MDVSKSGRARTVVVIVTALSLAFVACSSWREVDVKEAWRSPEGTRVRLLVGTCNAIRLSSQVQETDAEVRVVVTARGGAKNDCADVLEIDLPSPLGSRLLIDDFDGEPVPVALDQRLPDAQ
jgi:hypothetical protein